MGQPACPERTDKTLGGQQGLWATELREAAGPEGQGLKGPSQSCLDPARAPPWSLRKSNSTATGSDLSHV